MEKLGIHEGHVNRETEFQIQSHDQLLLPNQGYYIIRGVPNKSRGVPINSLKIGLAYLNSLAYSIILLIA